MDSLGGLVRTGVAYAGRGVALKVGGVAIALLIPLLILLSPMPGMLGEANAACPTQVGVPQVDLAAATGGRAGTAPSQQGTRTQQIANARVIDQVAQQRGLPGAAVRVALMAALTESSLLNLDHGDRDSLGLFQMRPSTGWGTPAQILDTTYAANAFFGGKSVPPNNPGLVDVAGWPEMAPGDAAQAVERSGYPDRYATHAAEAEDIAAAAGIDLSRAGDPYAGGGAGVEVSAGGVTVNAAVSVSQPCMTAGPGSVMFNVATYNALGDSHTRPGGDRYPHFADSRTRIGWAADAINAAGIDVMGFQEFQPVQAAAFLDVTHGDWALSKGDMDNRVAWRTATFSKLDERKLAIPYFGGNTRQMPYVLLEHKATKQRVWVMSTHNPADKFGSASQWRREAVQREAALANELAATGVPVIFTGDMNDREAYFCDMVSQAALHSASGGSPGVLTGACQPPPKPIPIDWVMGSPNVTFSGYTVTREGRLAEASDHPFVYATAAIPGPALPGAGGPVNAGNYGAEACSIRPDPSTGRGCLTPRGYAMWQAASRLPHKSISCWDEHAWNPTSDHPKGKACDVFFGPGGVMPNAQQKATGDSFAQFFIVNAATYGVNYVIWQGRIWESRSGQWKAYSGGGVYDPASITGGHYDHVHVSVY